MKQYVHGSTGAACLCSRRKLAAGRAKRAAWSAGWLVQLAGMALVVAAVVTLLQRQRLLSGSGGKARGSYALL